MPLPLALIPLIAAGISGVSSVIKGAQENRAVKKTNQANLELAKYQYQQEQEQINQMNLYNSPMMQMQRYKEAGLSPNLIYGQGTSGNQTSTPSFTPPDVRNVPPVMADVPSMIGTFQNVAMQQAQINQVKAQTENIQQETWNKQIQSMILNLTANQKDFDLNRRKTLAPYQLTVQQNMAQASDLMFPTAVQRLQNMTEDQKLKLLSQKYMQGSLTTQQQEQERQRLQIVFDTFRNQFKEMGVESSDSFWVRFFSRMLQESNIDIFGPAQNGFEKFKNFRGTGTNLKR